MSSSAFEYTSPLSSCYDEQSAQKNMSWVKSKRYQRGKKGNGEHGSYIFLFFFDISITFFFGVSDPPAVSRLFRGSVRLLCSERAFSFLFYLPLLLPFYLTLAFSRRLFGHQLRFAGPMYPLSLSLKICHRHNTTTPFSLLNSLGRVYLFPTSLSLPFLSEISLLRRSHRLGRLICCLVPSPFALLGTVSDCPHCIS